MCSAVRVCATDVASENWIHSRATGAARKKTMNEWMNDGCDFMRIIWELRDQSTGQ